MSRNQARADDFYPRTPLPAKCRCGHSRSYHRLVNDQHTSCFASPMLAPPCGCAQYRPAPEET